MANHEGLLVKIDDSGKISIYIQEGDDKIRLKDTTIKDELLDLAEIDFTEYKEIINKRNADLLSSEDNEEKRIQIYKNYLPKLESKLAEYKKFYGLLIRLTIDDNVREDDGTINYVYEYGDHLDDVLNTQFYVRLLFRDLAIEHQINFREDVYYNAVQISTIFYFEEGKVKQMYHIRSVPEYYFLLMYLFIKNDYPVGCCRLCSRYFFPKTKKKTLYCDRVVMDGKTCKQLAPKIKHILEARKNEVIKAFDKQRNKMYKRYDRTTNSDHEIDKPLTMEQYYDWLEKAQQARDDHLANKISKEEALRIICVE